MCRWGCATVDTTYMCKWCGTRYCRECLKGDFLGLMTEATKCRKCNQPKCQGHRVEYVSRPKVTDDDIKGRGKSAGRSRSASPSKRGKSAKSSGRKSAGSPKPKSGKKRKRR